MFHSRALLLCVTSTLIASFSFADEQADKIVRLADEARAPQVDFSVDVIVKDKRDGTVKSSRYHVLSKGTEKSLVEQVEPARLQGRKLLMLDKDLWLYTPLIRRPTRISFEQKLTGEVANGDLTRTNFAKDYSAKLIGEESLNGIATVKLHLTAKTKDATYRTVDYWVDTKNQRPVKAVFYAISGKPLKTALYSNFKIALGKPRMMVIAITDELQKSQSSRIEYRSYKRENFDDSIFNKEALAQ